MVDTVLSTGPVLSMFNLFAEALKSGQGRAAGLFVPSQKYNAESRAEGWWLATPLQRVTPLPVWPRAPARPFPDKTQKRNCHLVLSVENGVHRCHIFCHETPPFGRGRVLCKTPHSSVRPSTTVELPSLVWCTKQLAYASSSAQKRKKESHPEFTLVPICLGNLR